MKIGLSKIPTVKDLEKAYETLLEARLRIGSSTVDPEPFSLYCQWCRFDARLAEICVKYLCDHWKLIHPVPLREALSKQPWPSTIGVLTEFCEKMIAIEKPSDAKIFHLWNRLLTEGFKKAHWEQFFVGQKRIGGASMFEDARFSLKEYQKWGYLSQEVLFNKMVQGKNLKATVSYPPKTRVQIIQKLLDSHHRVTTDMYWNAVGRSISKRQAERDLKAQNFLQEFGRTKGRYFTRLKGIHS